MATRDTSVGTESAEPELLITRVFDAPRELVFKAWTEPERMKRWWGPKGFTMPYCTIDLRPGGAIRFCMRSPEGYDIWSRGIYREIVPPERVVCTTSFSDEAGNLISPVQVGMSPDFPQEMLMTVTFAEHDGKTIVTMRQAGFPLGADREGAQKGWGETLDRLTDYLAKA